MKANPELSNLNTDLKEKLGWLYEYLYMTILDSIFIDYETKLKMPIFYCFYIF